MKRCSLSSVGTALLAGPLPISAYKTDAIARKTRPLRVYAPYPDSCSEPIFLSELCFLRRWFLSGVGILRAGRKIFVQNVSLLATSVSA
jgi:hypothetical protein